MRKIAKTKTSYFLCLIFLFGSNSLAHNYTHFHIERLLIPVHSAFCQQNLHRTFPD